MIVTIHIIFILTTCFFESQINEIRAYILIMFNLKNANSHVSEFSRDGVNVIYDSSRSYLASVTAV